MLLALIVERDPLRQKQDQRNSPYVMLDRSDQVIRCFVLAVPKQQGRSSLSLATFYLSTNHDIALLVGIKFTVIGLLTGVYYNFSHLYTKK